MAAPAQTLTVNNTRPNQLVSYPGVGTVIRASQRTRPFWFDGRFLAARDLERDQNYFLRRQADLGKAAGFGVIHGLNLTQGADAETIVIGAGQGITPGGELVMLASDLTVVLSDLADAENLDEQFGLAETPVALARNRTGLYIVALRPVQFTANPISSWPTSLQGSPTTNDGNIVEASAVSLVPYTGATGDYDASMRDAQAARQVFLGGESTVSGSLLPLGMISIQRGAIEWIDSWLVRRDSGPEFAGLRFGLADPAAQQAFLLQYDARLQQIVSALSAKQQPAHFAATDYFQALPPAGRMPLASINVAAGSPMTQFFFPQQTDVWLSLIAADELPEWIEDSQSLPPIDLTLPASAYADLSVFVLIPVARAAFAGLAASLPPAPLRAALPQVANHRNTVSALRFFRGSATTSASTAAASGWTAAIGASIYGYYVRRRSQPVYVMPAALTTVTTLTSSGSDVAGVTLIASVVPTTATGSITFKDGATVLGVVALSAGVATLDPAPLSPGAHSLTASYQSDSNLLPSISLPLALTVTSVPFTKPAMTLTQVLIPGALLLEFKAVLSPPSATGSVLFQVDSGAQVSGQLIAGVAILQTAIPAAGAHTLNAEYTGDNAFAPAVAQLQFTV